MERMLDNADKGIPTSPAGLSVKLYLQEWLDYISAYVRPAPTLGMNPTRDFI